MVFVLYAFAKRILRSTPFATICAGLLLLDGFHFVQSRIATPEITVAFFSLTTLYAFYRFWIASQVRVAAVFDRLLGRREAIVLCFATVVAAGLALLARGQGRRRGRRGVPLRRDRFLSRDPVARSAPHALG